MIAKHLPAEVFINVCGDVVTDEMSQVHSKVVRTALAKK